MKKILITLALSYCAFFVSAQNTELRLRQILFSKNLEDGRPSIVYVDMGKEVSLSILVEGVYNSFKFPRSQDYIERGYGSYNDYQVKSSGKLIKFRIHTSNDNGTLHYWLVTEQDNNKKTQTRIQLKEAV